MRNIQTPDSFRHWWLARAPVLVANSKATEQSYLDRIGAAQRSVVIYNGVDLSWFDGERSGREKLGLRTDAFVIAQVGRIVRGKGVHIFVKALASVAARHPNVRGVIVGDASVNEDPAYVSEIEELVSGLGLAQGILFTGHVNDVRCVYAGTDLLVQPSASEGFGRTLIEAMAMRVPVIATNVGGPCEIVEDGVSGLLVPPNDPEALATAIERVIKDGSLATRLADSGRNRVQARFCLDRQVAETQALYDQVLA